MLKLTDLALRPDFQLGPMLVSPSRRLVEGPGGYTHVEPLIMHVFLLLLDAGGKVVTRNELFDQVWGGVMVGDDSLNRAIAKVRRIGAQVAPGMFEIETIPRTGYRLRGEVLKYLNGEAEYAEAARASVLVSRRALVGGGVAAAVAAGGAGLWWLSRPRDDPRFDALMHEATEASRDNSQFDPQKAGKALEQAVRIRPDNARAWGLLACIRQLLAEGLPPKDVAAGIASAAEAARRSLAINPKEPYGLLAMYELQGTTLDYWTRDQKLREVIALDPKNAWAISEIVLLLQAAGYSQESWNWNERGLTIEPLSPDFLGKRALKLWIAGRIADSDKVIDQLRDLYPTDLWPWWVRFLIYALTDRPKAAQAMMDGPGAAVQHGDERKMWTASLRALISRDASDIARARAACAEGARKSGDLAGQGVMTLSALGDVDGAFDIADGFLLSRGSIVRKGPPAVQASDAIFRINTQWLFTPPCAIMRADPRFMQLCDGMGLTEYWRRRGLKPDYMRA